MLHGRREVFNLLTYLDRQQKVLQIFAELLTPPREHPQGFARIPALKQLRGKGDGVGGLECVLAGFEEFRRPDWARLRRGLKVVANDEQQTLHRPEGV